MEKGMFLLTTKATIKGVAQPSELKVEAALCTKDKYWLITLTLTDLKGRFRIYDTTFDVSTEMQAKHRAITWIHNSIDSFTTHAVSATLASSEWQFDPEA